MLLLLDKNILDIDFANNDFANHALENLLATGVEGNHLISSDLATLKSLYQLSGISARSRAYLQRQINRFSEIGSLPKLIEVSLIIEGSLVDAYKDKKGKWHVPLLSFAHIELVVKTTLLAENLTDSRLYQHAAEHYKQKNGLTNLKISLTNQGGGGSTTSDEVKRRVNQPSGFCLCVLDSDKYSPNCNYGETANKCLAEISKTEVWWFDILITHKRELENELPEKFIENALASNKQFIEILGKYLKLKESLQTVGEDFIDYVDLKDGLSLNWIFSLPIDAKKYWAAAANQLTPESNCKTNCIPSLSCSSSCESNLLLNGVAPSLLSIVLSWIENQNPNSIAHQINNDKDLNWLNLGKKVCQYGVGGHIVRI